MLLTVKFSNTTGVFSPVEGTLRYKLTHSIVILTIVTLAGYGDLFLAPLYHTFIRSHLSCISGGSYVSKDSMEVPDLSVRLFWFSHRLSLIRRPKRLISAWSLVGSWINSTRECIPYQKCMINVFPILDITNDILLWCYSRKRFGDMKLTFKTGRSLGY